jgi:hypothetical protein
VRTKKAHRIRRPRRLGSFGDAGELLPRADVGAIDGKRYSVAAGTFEACTST